MEIYLYKQLGCSACKKARILLELQGYTQIREILVDNPLLELGIQMLFTDKQVHTPVIVIPDKGIYILNIEATQLFRLVSLQPEVEQIRV